MTRTTLLVVAVLAFTVVTLSGVSAPETNGAGSGVWIDFGETQPDFVIGHAVPSGSDGETLQLKSLSELTQEVSVTATENLALFPTAPAGLLSPEATMPFQATLIDPSLPATASFKVSRTATSLTTDVGLKAINLALDVVGVPCVSADDLQTLDAIAVSHVAAFSKVSADLKSTNWQTIGVDLTSALIAIGPELHTQLTLLEAKLGVSCGLELLGDVFWPLRVVSICADIVPTLFDYYDSSNEYQNAAAVVQFSYTPDPASRPLPSPSVPSKPGAGQTTPPQSIATPTATKAAQGPVTNPPPPPAPTQPPTATPRPTATPTATPQPAGVVNISCGALATVGVPFTCTASSSFGATFYNWTASSASPSAGNGPSFTTTSSYAGTVGISVHACSATQCADGSQSFLVKDAPAPTPTPQPPTHSVTVGVTGGYTTCDPSPSCSRSVTLTAQGYSRTLSVQLIRTTVGIAGGLFQGGVTFTGVPPGNYSVTVADGGCSVVDTNTVYCNTN